ncbi:ABC transporter ATP-binding protein [Paenisporosarcina cavernae]|uniref:ABC transporter ATP-binding protein n=1 Tax=Paenisporosarcina cavernae TaxID=2320858 RepID=A0A385YYF4_9BACL|nr:ABC transporter ATP-binding protein [Paenisporosarcina cavernae]AYC30658.1 ABC transporter ATP-binding protein [Paenisporosarcina cavernae]
MSTLLEVQHLSKYFQQFIAVDDISFTLNKGTSTALIGANGSGKTTTLSMLATLLQPTNGTIYWEGKPSQDIRPFVGFLPQYPMFYPWMTATEYVQLSAKLHGLESKGLLTKVNETLEAVGLSEVGKKKIGGFSGGMKQRLGLAQAIIHQPQLLLLDEPVSALDPVGRRDVMTILKNLLPEMTILYSTHILNDAEEMTDQLLFLSKGKVVEQGSLFDVKNRHAEPAIVVEFHSTEEAEAFQKLISYPSRRQDEKVWIDSSSEYVNVSTIMRELVEHHFSIVSINEKTTSLEELFMKVVAER